MNDAVKAFLATNQVNAQLITTAEGVSTHTAAEAAAALGITSEARVIKSLVCVAGNGVPLCVLVSGTDRVDFRALSAHMRCRTRLATPEEALVLTGHEVGCIPPFSAAQCSTLRTLIDERVLVQTSPVYAGGGVTGVHVCLSPRELQRATGAFVGNFAAVAPPSSRVVATPLPAASPLEQPDPADEQWRVGSQTADPADAADVVNTLDGGDIVGNGAPALRADVIDALATTEVVLPRVEVLRVRRQARLLVFATVRSVEPPRVVAPRLEPSAAGAPGVRPCVSDAVPAAVEALEAVDTWQLLLGKTLVNEAGEESAERCARQLRPGVVVSARGRPAINPRLGSAPDLVVRSLEVLAECCTCEHCVS